MKKAETKIIMNEYRIILEAENLGYNKDTEKVLLKRLIMNLGLEKEMYATANQYLIETRNYGVIVIDQFEMIEKDFNKYGIFIEYDINYIEDLYQDMQYDFTEEENNYYKKRINIIKNYINKEE